MSWSFSFSNAPKAQIDAVVDAAVISGQSPEKAPDLNDDVAAAKAAIKLLAPRIKRANISAGASGHSLEPGQDKSWHDGIGIHLTGSD